jgi:hypothetical protein
LICKLLIRFAKFARRLDACHASALPNAVKRATDLSDDPHDIPTDTHSVRSLAHEFYHRHLGRLRHALRYRPKPAGDGIKMIAIRPLARQRALSQRRSARRQSERHSGIALDLGLIACGDYLSYKNLKHERYKGDQGVILRQFHPRMTVDEFHAYVMQWLPNAKDRRW